MELAEYLFSTAMELLKKYSIAWFHSCSIAILLDNETWIADTVTGLNRYNNSFQNLVPNSPYGIATGR
jgi:hypothetical protein